MQCVDKESSGECGPHSIARTPKARFGDHFTHGRGIRLGHALSLQAYDKKNCSTDFEGGEFVDQLIFALSCIEPFPLPGEESVQCAGLLTRGEHCTGCS